MSKKKIAKSAFVIGLATALSRVLGYVRDLTVAFFFGTGTGAQSFVVAFRIPNLLRNLVGEGAANAALVPVFSEYLSTRDEKEFKDLIAALFSFFTVILVIFVAAGILFAPFLVKLIAPGFLKEENLYKYALTVKMTRLLSPYILLAGMGAWCMAILHSFKIFAPSSFGPVFLNIAIIGSAVFLRGNFSEPAMSLAAGALVGGVLQLSIQVPYLARKGIRIRFMFSAAAEGTKRIGRLLLPRAIGAAVYQINILVDTILASFGSIVGTGAVAALYFSQRIIQFPMGIFAIALATATLPTMSVQAINREDEGLRDTLSFSLRGVFLIMFPSMTGLFILAKPITKLLFQWGVFSNYSTNITADALFFYSFGLFAYAGVKILTGGFYALQDTKTPMKVAAGALIVNVVFNLVLMWRLKAGGLALATSISGIFNFGLLFYLLDKKLGYLDRRKIAVNCGKILIASLIMGMFCRGIFNNADFSFISCGVLSQITRIAVTILSSVLVFSVCVYVFAVEQVRSLVKWIFEKK